MRHEARQVPSWLICDVRQKMTLPTGNPDADAVIQLFGGVAAVVNIVGVVGVLWLKTQYKKALARQQHALDLKLVEHETTLSVKHEKEIELLRAELQRAAAERQLLFSAVYQKREEILRDLYRKLNEAINACDEAHRPGKSDMVDDAQRQMRHLHTEMENVASYFTASFCEKWHKHVEAVATALGQFKFAAETQTPNWNADKQLLAKAFDEYITAWKAIRTELRKEIRKLIGIEEP